MASTPSGIPARDAPLDPHESLDALIAARVVLQELLRQRNDGQLSDSQIVAAANAIRDGMRRIREEILRLG